VLEPEHDTTGILTLAALRQCSKKKSLEKPHLPTIPFNRELTPSRLGRAR
jgi:hypothetical protein